MEQSLKKILRTFQKPNERKSSYYILSTAILGFSSITLSVICYQYLWWVTFLMYPIIFLILCRSVILMHDAAHNALYKEKWKNSLAGNLMSLLNFTPNEFFGYMHNMHHATASNLDKRHINPEAMTLTKEEYLNASLSKKISYRFMRSPLFRLIFAPLGMLLVTRIPLPQLRLKEKIFTISYNFLIMLIFYAAYKFNFLSGLIVGYLIPLFACYVLVSIVFFLQHQFEDTYWINSNDWNNEDASLQGSSFLVFGSFLQKVFCNIGYHHIHHLNPLIPCYKLADAHNKVKNKILFKEVKLSQLFVHMKGKLWDQKLQKLVSFSEIY